jgi:hypothetical protein
MTNKIGIDQPEKTTPVWADRIVQTDSEDSNNTVWSTITNLASTIFGLKTTSDLDEGTNEYYTEDRVTANPTVVALWTDKENTANKSTDTALWTSDVLFPTQKAVKTYVDNIPSGASENTQTEVTFWETITAWLELRHWDDTEMDILFEQITYDQTDEFTNTDWFIWTTYTAEWLSWLNTTIDDVRLFRTDTPWSSSSPRITATVWDSPAKTTNLWSKISANSPTENAEFTLTFDTPIAAISWTQYFIEWEFDQMGSSSADFGWRENSTSVYSWGSLYKDWVEAPTKDLYFKVNQSGVVLEYWDKLYLADASDVDKSDVVWVANESGILDDVKKINTAWVDSNQTFLEADIGKALYLSDTPWEISTTPWTNVVKVWKIISTTEMLIDYSPISGQVSSTATTWGVTLWNAVGYVTVDIPWTGNVKIPYYNV